MKHYVKIRHPHRIGESIATIPTGEKRTTERDGTEVQVRVITPKTNLDTLWIKREDVIE